MVTNAHVIPDELASGSGEFLAVLTSERKGTAYSAKVVRVDKVHDLALLRFSGKPRPAFRLGNSEAVREGELYAFTGFPIGMVLGMRPVTHRGMVSAITPIAIPQISPKLLDPKMVKRLRDPYDVFQLDATASEFPRRNAGRGLPEKRGYIEDPAWLVEFSSFFFSV